MNDAGFIRELAEAVERLLATDLDRHDVHFAELAEERNEYPARQLREALTALGKLDQAAKVQRNTVTDSDYVQVRGKLLNLKAHLERMAGAGSVVVPLSWAFYVPPPWSDSEPDFVSLIRPCRHADAMAIERQEDARLFLAGVQGPPGSSIKLRKTYGLYFPRGRAADPFFLAYVGSKTMRPIRGFAEAGARRAASAETSGVLTPRGRQKLIQDIRGASRQDP